MQPAIWLQPSFLVHGTAEIARKLLRVCSFGIVPCDFPATRGWQRGEIV